MCVKSYAIWRAILDHFTLDDIEKDKRYIYLNIYNKYGMRITNAYRAQSCPGRTVSKLWGVHGHSYKVWYGDSSSFPEPVTKDNLVEIWKKYHLGGFQVSPGVRQVKISAGIIASEITFTVQKAQVISQLIFHDGKIVVISFKSDRRDPVVSFFFLDYPVLDYFKVKQLSDSISTKFKNSLNSKEKESSKKKDQPEKKTIK